MRKNLSVLILDSCSTSVRQISVPKKALRISAVLLVAGLVILGYGVYDYSVTKQKAARVLDLEARVTDQCRQIADQQEQIKTFAEDINTLKSKLVSLDAFEKKIRIIANVDGGKESAGVFGVGGSPPADLDADAFLEAHQNAVIREMHEQIEQLETASISQENQFASLYKYLENQKTILACTPSIRPTEGWISSSFGYRKSPFTGKREMHKGLDIANHKGTPILATADGVVTCSRRKGLLGKTVVIDHGHGFVTRYAHLSKMLVKKGQTVKRGDIIAHMGNTGKSTGPHLHYEVRLNGVQVNPQKYILN